MTSNDDVSADAGRVAALATAHRVRAKQALAKVLPAWAYRRILALWRARRWFRVRLEVLADYLYDARKYVKWAHGSGLSQSYRQQESALIKQMHGIEKGLALAAPRLGFGQAKVRALMERVDDWHATYGRDGMVGSAVAVLREYRDFHAVRDVPLPWLDSWLGKVAPFDGTLSLGGTVKITRKEIADAVARGGEAFFASRHSVRQFASAEVPIEDIARAVAMAQKTPSVCNRQSSKVYCFSNAMDALKWQPGNAGFGNLASRALIVTSDLQSFHGSGERNQCWIDGGMFAMSLVYALHALGYGTCTLAWSRRGSDDRKMREALDIPGNEVVIMMIAVGVLPETLSVARSLRRMPSDVLVVR